MRALLMGLALLFVMGPLFLFSLALLSTYFISIYVVAQDALVCRLRSLCSVNG